MCSPLEVIFAMAVEDKNQNAHSARGVVLACVVVVVVATTSLMPLMLRLRPPGQFNALKQRLSADTMAKLAMELSATKTCVGDQRAGVLARRR